MICPSISVVSAVEINLRRGVKRGDPLSPFTFNAIMNPLSEQLEELGGYTIDKTHTISCLAFADNLILVADNHDKDQELLTHREFYIKSLAITMAAHKCASL